MSSWSASAYPLPPRRSRSRSPPRGPYPLRDDAAYPPADYRAEWDAYNRGRWDDYQRYEYSRRGRSRSPPADESELVSTSDEYLIDDFVQLAGSGGDRHLHMNEIGTIHDLDTVMTMVCFSRLFHC